MPSLVVTPHLQPSKLPLVEDFYHKYFTPTTPPHTTSLPNAYIWPEHNRPSSLPDDIQPSPIGIPLIDMQADVHSLVSKLAHACEHWGVFYVDNHGVPLELLERVRENGHKLFSLPLTTKMKALRKDGSFEGFGKAMISKFFDSLLWSEGFTMMGHPSSSIADLTDTLFPHEYSQFREAFEEYDMAARGVAARLMKVILEGLGVEMEEFRKRHYDVEREGQAALQLNYYAPCPQPHLTMGLPPHTDSTCLTILHQGLVPGLEMLRHGTWSLVPPLSPSTFVVHVGDMLQVLSNGKYQSIVHRAIANKQRPRLSIACLCFPPTSATIAPPKEVVGSERPLYKPLRWGEYVQTKSKYFMNALDHFKNEKP